MNKARPTISGSLIKHRAYLTYRKYNKNVINSSSSNNNNNNSNHNINSNNNNNTNSSCSSSSSSSNNNNNKKKLEREISQEREPPEEISQERETRERSSLPSRDQFPLVYGANCNLPLVTIAI